MKTSEKAVKRIEDLIGKRTFFFPNEIANERTGNDLLPCIVVRVNGQSHFILTGQTVELTSQDYAILRDSGMNPDKYGGESNGEFDPLRAL